MRLPRLAVTLVQAAYAYTLADGSLVYHRWRGVVPRRLRSERDLRTTLAWAVRVRTSVDVDGHDLHLLEAYCWPRLVGSGEAA
jgi:hypothetical protein